MNWKSKLLLIAILLSAEVAFHIAFHLWPVLVGVTLFLVIAAIRIPQKNKEIRERLEAAKRGEVASTVRF